MSVARRNPSTLLILAASGLLLGCGADEPQKSAAEASQKAPIVDACAVLPAEAFAPAVGSPVNSFGGVNDMGSRGWTSSCFYSSDAEAFVTFNGMIRPMKSNAELVKFLVSMSEAVDNGDGSIEPAPGFDPPAAQYYTTEGDIFIVMAMADGYWVQAGADDLELARQTLKIALEHVP